MTAKFDTDQIQGTHSNLKDLEQQFNNFASTISNEIYNAINEIDRIIERLQHCISKIDSKHNQLMQTMHDLSSRLKALEDANRIHESKVNFIKNEISKLETQIDNLQKQLNKEYNILANCRPAYTKIIYYEDGTSAEVLVDPDGAKRQAAQSNIDSLKRQIDQ